jgi:hypothetical protein
VGRDSATTLGGRLPSKRLACPFPVVPVYANATITIRFVPWRPGQSTMPP